MSSPQIPGPPHPLNAWRPVAALALACVIIAASHALAAASPGPSGGAPLDSVALPISWHVVPESPCAGDTVGLRIDLCWPCARLRTVELSDSGYVQVVVVTRDSVPCAEWRLCPSESRSVLLGRLAAGHFSQQIRLTTIDIGPDSSETVSHSTHIATFDVGPDCDPDGLPFVDNFQVRTANCRRCAFPPCAGGPLVLDLWGMLPNACWQLRSVRLLPTITPITPPEPPTVQVVVFSPCPDSLDCPIEPVPWSVSLPFAAGVPPGTHEFDIQVLQRSCADSTSSPLFFRKRFSYELRDCGPSAGCIEPFLVPVVRDSGVLRCDAFVGPNAPARITFGIRSDSRVAGLQGHLTLGDSFAAAGLRIRQIQALDFSPFQVAWQPTPDGADYLFFSTSGAVLPAGHIVPALVVTVALDSGATAPVRAPLSGSIDVASDSAGTKISPCIHVLPPDLPSIAWLCSRSAGCDVNGDGVANVRDLVRMVHCLLLRGVSSDSASCAFDCDGNNAIELADVLCCARRILHGDDPDTSQALPAPGVGITFGVPSATVTGVELPVALEGADAVGAASIALRFPADRFTVQALRADGEPPGWLVLHELDGDAVKIGAIRIAPDAPARLSFTLVLGLRAGQAAGGSVSLAGGEFSSPDGARLEVPMAPMAASLGGAAAAATLSPALPNPTGGETRFVVSLPRAASAELTIVDLSGRRIATIHRGPLEAGTRAFVWDGGGAPNGVYFARLVVDGQTIGRRVTLLRGR